MEKTKHVLCDWRRDWKGSGDPLLGDASIQVFTYGELGEGPSCITVYHPYDKGYTKLAAVLSWMEPSFCPKGNYLRGFVLTREEYDSIVRK